MNRNTLARHRLTGGHRFARTSAEGGGGGGTNTGGSNTGGGSTGGTDPGAGGGTDNAGTGGGSNGPVTDPSDPNYFPPNTAVAEMTERQQAAYWRNQTKVANARVPGNLLELQRKATEYDELVAATRSEGEVAIDEALEIGREEGRAEVRIEAAGEFLRGQLSVGRTEEAVNTLMRGVSAAGFVGDDGKIDYPGIRAFAATLGGGTQQDPDIGNGRRGGQGKPSVASGRELYQDRQPKRTPANTAS